MGLSWQQGPLASVAVGRFLTDLPLPERLLYVEPLRRRMRVKFAGEWIADSEDVLLLHEPGRYPVAYFPLADVRDGVLQPESRSTQHAELGTTSWFAIAVGDKTAAHAAWQYSALPGHAEIMRGYVAFAWRAMDAFYEEDERIVGHAADPYHRIDIRQSSRHLVVKSGEVIVADTKRPVVLFESGFAPRWYVPRADIHESTLQVVDVQTFCPYKGLATYYNVGEKRRAAWGYFEPWPEVRSISNFLSFEADLLDIWLDGKKMKMPPGQNVTPHGIDRGLDPDEIIERGR